MASKLALVALGTAAIAGPILLALTSALQVQAQSAPTASALMPSFEVASVRRSGPRETTSSEILPNRLTMRAFPMLPLILMAYGRDFGDFGYRNLRGDQLVGAPQWVRGGEFGAEFYDIDARVDDSLAEKFGKPCSQAAWSFGRCAYRQPLILMLQSLLADRFKLRLRRETKQGPVYALVPAKGGSKLSPCSLPFSPTDTSAIPPKPSRCPAGMNCVEGCMPVALLADRLSFLARLGRPVIDQTGLKAAFNVKLQFEQIHIENEAESKSSNPAMASPPPVSPIGPSIFKAVQNQLGLKLKATKGPVETLVIEHIERPSEN